jgi:hypothetical protein
MNGTYPIVALWIGETVDVPRLRSKSLRIQSVTSGRHRCGRISKGASVCVCEGVKGGSRCATNQYWDYLVRPWIIVDVGERIFMTASGLPWRRVASRARCSPGEIQYVVSPY